jgi:glyoxylase I family protein
VTHRPPFSLEALDHVLLLVRGMEGSLVFYEDVLGARAESHLPQYAMVELRAGTSHLDLVDVAAPEGRWALPSVHGGRNVDHIALKVGACDENELRRHLAMHDVAIVEERSENDARGAILSLYVRDPSGNVVELIARVGGPDYTGREVETNSI